MLASRPTLFRSARGMGYADLDRNVSDGDALFKQVFECFYSEHRGGIHVICRGRRGAHETANGRSILCWYGS